MPNYLWILATGAALCVGILLLVAVAACVATWMDVRSLVPLTPLPEDEAYGSEHVRSIAADLRGENMLSVGVFESRESRLLTAKVELFLSEDGCTLALLPSVARFAGWRLLTGRSDGCWWSTGTAGSGGDLSGLVEEDTLAAEATASEVLKQHLDRIHFHTQATGTSALTWDPATLVEDLLEHDRRVAEATIARGCGRCQSRPLTRGFRLHPRKSSTAGWGAH